MPSPSETEASRRLAAALFDRTWELLEVPLRTTEQDDELIHAAHASCYHWGLVGEPVNRARGEWMIGRVYAVLGFSEPAVRHSRRCLEICEENKIEDFDLAFAHEGLARAYKVAGDIAASNHHRQLAEKYGAMIEDEEDRDYFFKDLDWVAP